MLSLLKSTLSRNFKSRELVLTNSELETIDKYLLVSSLGA